MVISGGNHVSPALLGAPRELLRTLDIHVVGAASACLDKEILLLRDRTGRPELLVCAAAEALVRQPTPTCRLSSWPICLSPVV